ncbi:helicase-associated domain-containing protein [Microbacterium koreense]|uniref:Helicase-associated domain-containing protein n=1 Tax=Microbacterium koreense TaxID=323761 RepID=A0ABW2ZQP5_9MICO
MTSDERALATWLSERDDIALATVFATRGVNPAAGWGDFFDAAAALLDPAAVDRTLIGLPRGALAALARADRTGLDPALALADDERIYDAVTDRLALLRDRHPDAFIDVIAVADPPVGGEAAAAERAFSAAGALADILLSTLHASLSRTGAGPVSASDRKRLIDGGAIDTAEELEELVTAAEAAGLIEGVGREWIVTDAGERWLEASTADRWAVIVHGLIDALPAGIRRGHGILPLSQWADARPLDPAWPGRADLLTRIAVRWGLAADDGSEPEWGASLRAGEALDTTTFAAQLPAEIDRVYLQADLTAIAPGPLAPALDVRLRRIARRESRAQASTYRFTAESLAAGMTEGETAEGISEFLTGLSLTGIPQPLAYLLESTASRHGLVRVRVDAVTGRTHVESTDAALLDALAVDQALRPLGLVPTESGLVSRVARDAVYWALADARYPVTALDTAGSPEPVHRRTPPPVTRESGDAPARYADLIAALRVSHDDDDDAAWLGRELDQAVRARATVIVDVRLPDGSQRSFTLEATGLGGGRMRGLDRGADIERTLPISSIVSVRPA